MDFFSFYELPEAFELDEKLVKQKFYQLSKKFHPDFHVNESPDKQDEILSLSTLNNKAYEVLSDKAKRLEYILQQRDLISEGEKYQLPQDFLMEMMEVNEVLMELEFNPDQEVLQNTLKQVDAIEHDLATELKSYCNHFDREKNSSEKDLLLLKIKDLYYRQKYLLRIRRSLDKFASR